MAKHKKEEGTRSASAARANIRYERVRLKWLPKLFNVRKVLKYRLAADQKLQQVFADKSALGGYLRAFEKGVVRSVEKADRPNSLISLKSVESEMGDLYVSFNLNTLCDVYRNATRGHGAFEIKGMQINNRTEFLCSSDTITYGDESWSISVRDLTTGAYYIAYCEASDDGVKGSFTYHSATLNNGVLTVYPLEVVRV